MAHIVIAEEELLVLLLPLPLPPLLNPYPSIFLFLFFFFLSVIFLLSKWDISFVQVGNFVCRSGKFRLSKW